MMNRSPFTAQPPQVEGPLTPSQLTPTSYYAQPAVKRNARLDEADKLKNSPQRYLFENLRTG
jgi:hypothetical protein